MSMMGNEFSGLPIADLIGGPLNAACDAQIRLAKATADFINSVGFNPETDPDTKQTKLVPRQVDFSFWQPLAMESTASPEVLSSGILILQSGTKGEISSITISNASLLATAVPYHENLEQTAKDIASAINSGSSNYKASANGTAITIVAPAGSGSALNGMTSTSVTASDLIISEAVMANGKDAVAASKEAKVQKVVVSVPFLAIVNVPSLMIKSVDVTFDMEVKSSESHRDSQDKEAALDATAKVGWGPFSAEVKVHGSISSHQENTRSTDRSAKYHIQVQARDDGMPEGLSRVLDILQKAIVPVGMSKAVSLADAKLAQNQKVIA